MCSAGTPCNLFSWLAARSEVLPRIWELMKEPYGVTRESRTYQKKTGLQLNRELIPITTCGARGTGKPILMRSRGCFRSPWTEVSARSSAIIFFGFSAFMLPTNVSLGQHKEIFDEVSFRNRILRTIIYSPLWRLDNWLKAESPAMNSRSGIVQLSHECRPVHNPDVSGLEELILALLSFVSRLELRVHIQEEALVKARRVLRCLTFDRDEKLMRKAKHMTPQGFAELISQRLAYQNLLSGNRGSLLA